MTWNPVRIRIIVCAASVATGLALMLTPARSARASTVLEVGVADMLARCELIFEGEVLEVWSEPSPRGIHTWVRFEVRDVVSGPALGPGLVLRFLGGRIGDRIEEVAGLRIPEPGERGFYFVESLRRFQVNPLYGWDQGRLRIVPDRLGRPRVVTAGGQPVVGVDGGAIPDARRLSSRVARGVRVVPEAALSHALSPAELKAVLAAVLRKAR